MHSIIDDFAWVAIGLVVVAFLFLLGAAYIFLDDGIRRLVRRLRKPAGVAIPRLASQTIEPSSGRLSAPGKPDRMPKGPHAPLVNPHRASGPAIWRTLRAKIREAKSGTHLRLHLRHHKPANAKP